MVDHAGGSGGGGTSGISTSAAKHCDKCGGLIAEPGVVYGYGGKFCHCPVNISSGTFNFGWTCSKCGRSWNPGVSGCESCNILLGGSK